MKKCNWIVTPLVALAVAACGGGGGDAGTKVLGAETSSPTATPTVPAPTMTLQLLDSADQPLASPSLSQTELRKLKVTLKDAKGVAQAFKLITVMLSQSSMAVLVPPTGTQLTNAEGVAWFTVAPASVTASGAMTVIAQASVDGTDVTQTFALKIEPGNVALSGLTVAPTSVQLGQSVNVSAQVNVNGSAAASNSVTVAFSSGCGTVAPALVPVDASGKASAVIQTTMSGSCSVSATAAGVSVPPASFLVTAPPITGIQFVSADPPVIYQQDSVGVNSSLVKFKVIDSNGDPVPGQTVSADLVNGTGGLHFCDPATSAKTAVSAATTGEVSFSICSGTQPETAQVRARLTAPAIFTDSNLLAVQTGWPTQRFFDIAADKLNFYAGGLFTSKLNNDGVNITVNLADRQGNPVPNGTPVTLVTEGGQINSSNVSSCVINDGACTVRLIGQDYRPLGAPPPGDQRPGRVTVLAMADGEESFIDANNNNRYDPGELFEDLGVPFMDKNEDGRFSAAYQNLVVGTNEGEVSYSIAPAALGGLACPGNSNVGLSGATTCNGVWNGSGHTPTKVRRSIVIVFSGGEIGLPNTQSTSFPTCKHSVAASTAMAGDGYYIDLVSRQPVIPSIHHTELRACSNEGIAVRLADRDGNPLPADAAIKVVVRKPENSQCSATLNGSNIGSSIEPTTHSALLEKCSGGEWLDFTVTVGSGGSTKTSVFSVLVPPPTTTP